MSSALWIAIGAGSASGLLLEALTLRARLRTLRNLQPVLPLIVRGFLARLTLLLTGTLAGSAGLWDPQAFLLSALTAILLGEIYAFARIHRLAKARSSNSSSASSPQ